MGSGAATSRSLTRVMTLRGRRIPRDPLPTLNVGQPQIGSTSTFYFLFCGRSATRVLRVFSAGLPPKPCLWTSVVSVLIQLASAHPSLLAMSKCSFFFLHSYWGRIKLKLLRRESGGCGAAFHHAETGIPALLRRGGDTVEYAQCEKPCPSTTAFAPK